MKDLYAILDLLKDATQEEIKAAFRELSKQHHPDVKGGDHQKMIDIAEAYKVLSNPQKRAHYDSTGKMKFDEFDSKFINYVGSIFMSMLEQMGETDNPIEEFRRFNLDKIYKSQMSILQVEVKKRQLEKTLEKISSKSNGIIMMVINGEIDSLSKSIINIKEDIAFLEKVEEVIQEYEYDDRGASRFRQYLSA